MLSVRAGEEEGEEEVEKWRKGRDQVQVIGRGGRWMEREGSLHL